MARELQLPVGIIFKYILNDPVQVEYICVGKRFFRRFNKQEHHDENHAREINGILSTFTNYNIEVPVDRVSRQHQQALTIRDKVLNMGFIQSESNSNDQCKVIKYNLSCAGKNCKNVPMYNLKLVLIKRSGWFCENCTQNLQENGLVESIIDKSIRTRGENNFGED